MLIIISAMLSALTCVFLLFWWLHWWLGRDRTTKTIREILDEAGNEATREFLRRNFELAGCWTKEDEPKAIVKPVPIKGAQGAGTFGPQGSTSNLDTYARLLVSQRTTFQDLVSQRDDLLSQTVQITRMCDTCSFTTLLILSREAAHHTFKHAWYCHNCTQDRMRKLGNLMAFQHTSDELPPLQVYNPVPELLRSVSDHDQL